MGAPSSSPPPTADGEPLRVLFAVPAYPPPVVGGLERQAHELAKALQRRGVRVTVLSGQVMPGQASGEHDGVSVSRLPGGAHVKRALVLARWMWARRRDYDVVHLHNITWFGVPVITAARWLGKPVLTKLPNTGMIGGLPLQTSRPFGRVWTSVFKRSDGVVAMNDDTVAELRDVGFPTERVFRATNGVSVTTFHPASDARRPGPVRVVFAGRLSPEKGVADLLAAWPAVLAALGADAAHLDVYGEGPQEGELRAQAEALGLCASVAFRGRSSDIPAVLREADLFVLPSYAEGNPNAVLEAMASGLPVVGTRVNGTERIVGAAGRPWLVAPGDRAALADALARMAGDAALRAEQGRAMRARAEEAFDIDRVAGMYERAYRCLAQGRSQALSSMPSPAWDAGS